MARALEAPETLVLAIRALSAPASIAVAAASRMVASPCDVRDNLFKVYHRLVLRPGTLISTCQGHL